MITIICDTPGCKSKVSGPSAINMVGFEDGSYTMTTCITGKDLDFKIKQDSQVCQKCLDNLQRDITELITNNPAFEVKS